MHLGLKPNAVSARHLGLRSGASTTLTRTAGSQRPRWSRFWSRSSGARKPPPFAVAGLHGCWCGVLRFVADAPFVTARVRRVSTSFAHRRLTLLSHLLLASHAQLICLLPCAFSQRADGAAVHGETVQQHGQARRRQRLVHAAGTCLFCSFCLLCAVLLPVSFVPRWSLCVVRCCSVIVAVEPALASPFGMPRVCWWHVLRSSCG
jgi:hypothetical protein